MTPAEMRAYIDGAPYPMAGRPIWERHCTNKYDLAATATARAMLIVAEEDPSLLDVPSKDDDPTGIDRAFADAPWVKAQERWPGLDDWLGGVTGFMFGWANGAVRYILGAEPVGNPAILTLTLPDEGESEAAS